MPSTVIRKVAYDESSKTLDVTFVTGRRYLYEDVPQPVFEAFKTAPSRGGFFNHEIRDRYRFYQIRRRLKPRN